MKQLTLEQEIHLLKTTKNAYKFEKKLRDKGLNHAKATAAANQYMVECLYQFSEINNLESLNKVLIKKQSEFRDINNGLVQLKIKLPEILRNAFQKKLKKKKVTATGLLNDFIESWLK